MRETLRKKIPDSYAVPVKLPAVLTLCVNLLSDKFLCTTLLSLSFFRLKLNILKICFAFGKIICETIKEGAPELRLIVSSES